MLPRRSRRGGRLFRPMFFSAHCVRRETEHRAPADGLLRMNYA